MKAAHDTMTEFTAVALILTFKTFGIDSVLINECWEASFDFRSSCDALTLREKTKSSKHGAI